MRKQAPRAATPYDVEVGGRRRVFSEVCDPEREIGPEPLEVGPDPPVIGKE
jgi:hypothetical protein